MKILNPKIHGYIDLLTVVIFALAPAILNFSGLPATISYLLAVVHLSLTLITKFQLGKIKIIPFSIHGIIELLVSIVLVALPWLFSFAEDSVSKNFYIGIGIVVFLVWLLSSYKNIQNPSKNLE